MLLADWVYNLFVRLNSNGADVLNGISETISPQNDKVPKFTLTKWSDFVQSGQFHICIYRTFVTEWKISGFPRDS